jgi:hypothetical protein
MVGDPPHDRYRYTTTKLRRKAHTDGVQSSTFIEHQRSGTDRNRVVTRTGARHSLAFGPGRERVCKGLNLFQLDTSRMEPEGGKPAWKARQSERCVRAIDDSTWTCPAGTDRGNHHRVDRREVGHV